MKTGLLPEEGDQAGGDKRKQQLSRYGDSRFKPVLFPVRYSWFTEKRSLRLLRQISFYPLYTVR